MCKYIFPCNIGTEHRKCLGNAADNDDDDDDGDDDNNNNSENA